MIEKLEKRLRGYENKEWLIKKKVDYIECIREVRVEGNGIWLFRVEEFIKLFLVYNLFIVKIYFRYEGIGGEKWKKRGLRVFKIIIILLKRILKIKISFGIVIFNICFFFY